MKQQIEEFAKIGITDSLKDGNNAVQCPECKDSRKDANKSKKPLTVHVEINNNWYHCNHCGWKGSVENLEKYKILHEKVNYQKPSSYSDKVKRYITSRGITEYTMKLCGVQEQKRKGKDYLVFPLTRNGVIVNAIFRGVDQKSFFLGKKDDGAEMVFLGLDDIDLSHPEIIITEGIFDYLTLRNIRDKHNNPVYKNVISVPAGVPPVGSEIKPESLSYLYEHKFVSIAPNIKKFILFTDGDEAGRWLASILASKLQKPRCCTVRYPNGCKDNDPNGVYLQYGETAIAEMITNARPYPLRGVIKAFDIKERVDQIRDTGFTPGYKCGKPSVDNLYTFKPPYFYVVTGKSGTGKSVFTRWYFKNLIDNNEAANLHFCVFSPEMRPPQREIAMWSQLLAGGDIKRNEANSMSEDSYYKALKWIDEHLTFIAPGVNNFESMDGKINESNFNTVESLFEHVKAVKNQRDVTGVILDAWNTLDHKLLSGENEVQYINRTLEQILEFSETYDVGFWMIAHPHKLTPIGGKKNNPNVPRAHMYNINGGQPWENKTDTGIVLHRNPFIEKIDEQTGDHAISPQGEYLWVRSEDAPLEIHIDKAKFREIAKYGSTEVTMSDYENFITECDGEQGYCDRPIRDLKIEKNNGFDKELPF
jgi:twinkle protein